MKAATAAGSAGPGRRPSGAWLPSQRSTRLASGLVLFVYVATHLVNHALGLVSIDVAERGLRVATAVWRSVPGTVLLYGAAASHVALALLAVYRHRTLRMPPLELLRIALGLGIPTLLIGHAVSTRAAHALYGAPADYAHVVWALEQSGRQGWQLALLVPGWLHGCLGLRFAFRSRAAFARLRLPLFALALVVPVLAIAGFVAMTKEVARLAEDPAWAARVEPVDPAQRQALDGLRHGLLLAYAGAIGAVLAGRLVRGAVERRRGVLVAIRYPRRTVRVPRGWTLLEASRSHHIAHASACGGRGRCSTCRVRVTAGPAASPPPGAAERQTLSRVGAPDGTRLACQWRPTADVSVVPLVSPQRGQAGDAAPDTTEHRAAILVVEMRQHPPHRLLPHDWLYAQDEFEHVLGDAIRAHGGRLARSTRGRRVGIFPTGGRGAGSALRCAAALVPTLRTLGDRLASQFTGRATHALHLHAGTVVVRTAPNGPDAMPRAAGRAIDEIEMMVDAVPRDGDDGIGLTMTRAVHAFGEGGPAELAWTRHVLDDATPVDIACWCPLPAGRRAARE